MPAFDNLDQDLLRKLLLGQLPSAEVERLAEELAQDDRLAKLAESVIGNDDTLLELLHNHETVVDAEGERLVERLLIRLKSDLSSVSRGEYSGMDSGTATQPGSPDQTAPLPERLDFYRPIKVLGQGGMGTVYLAEDTRLGREVAIKTLRPELAVNAGAKERFLREARSAAKLEHDHVIPIYSVGEADGTPFLAMPLLKGEPLDALIRRANGPLPVALAVRLAREVASGLAAAHERGLIHRDIKPANIWLEAPHGRVKILDFGLAKAADTGNEGHTETNLTASGAIVGTPAYMAPEQAGGSAVDGRADLFSLGCVLYEMLAGKRAFGGPNTMSILMSLANQIPPAPDSLSPDCPAALSRLVMQLLEKDPAKRPPSAAAVIQALHELDLESAVVPPLAHSVNPSTQIPSRMANTAVMTAPAVQPDSARAATPRRPTTAIAAVCLLLAFGVAVLFGGQIVRVMTNQGELVVEIDDPNIEIRIRQDGIVVHDRPKEREFLLKAKNGEIEVLEQDGFHLTTRMFELTRGGTKRVKVTLEDLAAARQKKKAEKTEPAPTTPLVDQDSPFVLLDSTGKQRDKFNTLDGVLTSLTDGDVIEVHGNGPFILGVVTVRGKGLRMKAAKGYRPQFVLSKAASGYFWFTIENGALDIEGCDFRCGNGLGYSFVNGNGPAWEFRNCKLVGANVGFVGYHGPRLRFTDCLISGFTPPGNEGFGPGAAKSVLEMKNCIVWARGYQLLQTPGNEADKGSWHVFLQHNTLYVNGALTLGVLRKTYGKMRIEATGNLFQTTGMANTEVLKETGGWLGRDNLYVGLPALVTLPKGAKDAQHGLAAWQQFWGQDEQGGREAEWAHFAWDEVRRKGHDPQGVIQALTPVTAALIKQHEPALQEFGPDWDLIGPGDAYVRALAAAGKPVPQKDLRPAPLADGPFILIRQDKVVRGYPNLGEAVTAAESGDAIEIRSDDPFGRYVFTGDKSRQLTVRAAPGYRPIADGGLDFDSKNLTLVIEGLHFRKAPLGAGLGGHSTDAAVQNKIGRLANCSFASETDFIQYAGRVPRNGVNGPRFQGAKDQPGEIVNCLIPGIVATTLPAEGKLSVRNSVVGTFRIHLNSAGSRNLELERCVIWNPCGDLTAIDVGTTDPAKIKAQLSVTARQTLFEPGSRFIYLNQGAELTEWKGIKNVYRVGHRAWLTQGDKLGTIGLEDWRLRWQTDADSFEADPVDYDPKQWRLLPSNPGGEDVGADVGRIATDGH